MYEVGWDRYGARYDTAASGDVFIASFPNGYTLAGPAGTLIGFKDLVDRVLVAVDDGKAEVIIGAYVWPPRGVFLSQTTRLDIHSTFGRLLKLDSAHPDHAWYAHMPWSREGEDWYSTASVGIRLWRALSPALQELMAHTDVRQMEEAAAQRS
jgi:hypothetical protein